MRRFALLASVAVFAMAGAVPAVAQQDDRRITPRLTANLGVRWTFNITELQRQVHELRSIVFQGRDTGQPVEVKPAGPDPVVTALQTKVDDLEQSLRQTTGQNEVLTHDLDEARRSRENDRAQATSRDQALSDRIAKLEATLAATAPGVAPAPAPEASPPAGEAVGAPAFDPVACYAVEERDGKVFVGSKIETKPATPTSLRRPTSIPTPPRSSPPPIIRARRRASRPIWPPSRTAPALRRRATPSARASTPARTTPRRRAPTPCR